MLPKGRTPLTRAYGVVRNVVLHRSRNLSPVAPNRRLSNSRMVLTNGSRSRLQFIQAGTLLRRVRYFNKPAKAY